MQRLLLVRSLASSAARLGREKLVLGCGSNVVDHIYRVRVVPQAGAKGFFSSPFRALEKRLIGGVTLNHLSWAALGGVRAGLLALQGEDDLGRLVRRDLRQLGVATNFIATDSSYSTAQCHVFIQDGGERSIIMAPAATSLISADAVRKNFDEAIQQHASMVTTEISQVPLSGVKELLKSAKKAGVLSVLDLDIPPSVAEREAELGGVAEVVECAKMADILKPAREAAEELVSIMVGSHCEPDCLAEELVRLCGSKLVAMTNAGDDDGEMAGFHSSLANDQAAASAVCESLLQDSAQEFVSALAACHGAIFTSGVGKSGAVASRFAGSLSSLGLPSHFVHASEWAHGDLGKAVAGRDVVVFISHGGETRECVEAAAELVRKGIATLAITSNPESQLSQLSLASLTYPSDDFAEPFQLMPTSTIVIQEMLCNALVCELIQRRVVTKEVFLSNHPGGSIGLKNDSCV